ncbi:MAG: FAD binding domain-containing protein [Desulfobacterales bacterium]|nr:FAD binding domain-containing protein [Desulfobacterales bacterium]
MSAVGYFRPRTLAEALAFLAENEPGTKVVAGGTDVMVDLRAGVLTPECLLDVSRLEPLRGIALTDDGLAVGAAVTLAEIQRSALLKTHAPALQKSTVNFASRQIRNVATIGGNVAHCSPCGDTLPALVIHEAQAMLASPRGERVVAVEEIASGPYLCALPEDELIVRFILKPAAVAFADFQKIGRRKELAIARMSMAYMANKDAAGRVSFLRFSLGSCTPTPQRMPQVEAMLLGQVPSAALLWEAGRVLAESMIAITGRRASAAYKEPAIQGLFMRMLHPMV